jgi:signal transduction histidine kinase/CHASE3 domain sensor protein
VDLKRFKPFLGKTIMIPLLALLTLAGATLWTAGALNTRLEEVDRSDHAIEQGQLLLTAVVDMETSARGYLLTGDDLFLDPYKQAQEIVEPGYVRLRQSVGGDPAQQARLDRFYHGYLQWHRLADEDLLLRRTGNREFRLTDALSRKAQMDALRNYLREFEVAAVQLREERNTTAHQLWWWSKLGWAVLGSTLCLGISIFIFKRTLIMSAAFTATLATETQMMRERVGALILATSEIVYHMSPDWSEMRHLMGFGLLADTSEPDRDWMNKYIHPEDQARVSATIADAISRKKVFFLEHRIRHLDGTLGWTSSRAIPLLNKDGELFEWLGVATDITARKLSDENMLANGKLVVAGRMAAAIAHEINNPLAAVMNTVYLAKTNSRDPVLVRKCLEIAEEELNNVSHITRQTLGFYHESSNPAPVSVNSILDLTIVLLRGKIKSKAVRIVKQYKDELLTSGVAGELRQVFSNLVLNSIEAVKGDGVITLRVSKSTCVNTGKPRIRISVSDNGKGIKPETASRIFEPLFTTKEGTGTGLGLWVSKQIIEKHGGSIRGHSNSRSPFNRTVFSVLLPALVTPPTKVAEPNGACQRV